MAKVAQKAMDAAGVTADELEAFIPHQANMRIIDEFAKQLKLPDTVVVARDIATPATRRPRRSRWRPTGCSRRTRCSAARLALQIGFGAGLVYGAQVVVLP